MTTELETFVKRISWLVKFIGMTFLFVMHITALFLVFVGVGELGLGNPIETLTVAAVITFVSLGSSLLLGHIDKHWRI